MTKTVSRILYSAKRVRDLSVGDIIVKPYKGPVQVKEIRHGLKSAWMRLEGLDRPYHVGVWKRLDTVVAIKS